MPEAHERVQTVGAALQRAIGSVIVGKEDVVFLAAVCILADGHLLLEDVPGLGKTTLAKSIARALGCSFRRIQCTPDLLPSDVLGTMVFEPATGSFRYRPGPLFSNIVLTDEINRATPRTQSALLEAMEERQVSVDDETRALPRPFLLLATQNPVELEGTFPLPEAQLDRFLLRAQLGYPTEEDERGILRRFRSDSPLEEILPASSAEELLEMQHAVRTVTVSEPVEEYVVRLVRATRAHAAIELGASPRASLGLVRAAQAAAALRGRGHVLPDDVKGLAPAVLSHRLMVSPAARLRGRKVEQIVAEIVEATPAPVDA